VKAADGKRGVVFDESPEAQAFSRWQHGEFHEVERRFAAGWRRMLTTLDLPAIAERIRTLGISPKECKTVEIASVIASTLVHQRQKPVDQMALLFSFLDIPPDLQRAILQRWSIDQFRPLAEYSPYAAHVLVVELFFQIALAANLISAERPSNRIDVAYLCYLPFSTVFISSDKLHRKCAPVFLRNNQEFVWGPDLKRDLGRVNNEFSKLAPAELEKGLMNFARAPLGEPTDLIVALWDRHTPNWRTPRDTPVPMAREEKKKLLEHLRLLTDASTEGDAIGLETDDMDQMAIERMVPKKKGSWWLLPRDLKVEDKRGR
jgi:hypothetical protein